LLPNGKRYRLDSLKLNKIELARDEGEVGSCPILYTQAGDEADFARYGKILHNANAIMVDGIERIQVPATIRRVRISEEESEVTFLREVHLTYQMRDGTRRSVWPVNPQAAIIPADHFVEFEFPLLSEAEVGEVVSTTLEIIGRYERYSTLGR